MRNCRCGVSDCHTGHHRCAKHIEEVRFVGLTFAPDHRQTFCPGLEACIHTHPAVVSRLGVEIALDEMCQCIKCRITEDFSRCTGEVLAVKQGKIRKYFVRYRFLDHLISVREDRDGCNFRTGAAGRRNRDDRQSHAVTVRFIEIVDILIGFFDHEGYCFRRVKRGTAADADYEINMFRNAEIAGFHDCLDGGIFLHLIEYNMCDSFTVECCGEIIVGAICKCGMTACYNQRLRAECSDVFCVVLNCVLLFKYFDGHIEHGHDSTSV